MEKMEALIAISIIIYLLTSVFFYFLIQPWWAIIDCAISKRSNGSKLVWILSMLFLFVLAPFIYAVFATSSNLLRWSSIILLGPIFLLSITTTAFLVRNPEIFSHMEKLGEAMNEASKDGTSFSDFIKSFEGIENIDELEKKLQEMEEKSKPLRETNEAPETQAA